MDLKTCEGLLIAAVFVVVLGILIVVIIILAIWKSKRCGRLFSPSIPFYQDLTDSQVDRPRDVRPSTSSLRHTSRGETQPGVSETAATSEQDGGTLHRKERLSHKPSTQYSTRSSTKSELSTLDRVFHAPDVFRFSKQTNAGKQNKSSIYCKSRHPSQSDLLDSPSAQDSGEELEDEVQDGDSTGGRVVSQLSVDRTTESRPKRRCVVSMLSRVLDVPSVFNQRSQTNFEMEDKRSKYDVSEVNPSRHLDDVSSDVEGAGGKCDTEQKQWRKRSLKRTSSNKRESLSAIFDRVLDVPKSFRRKKPIHHDTEMTSVQPEEYDKTRHTSQADLLTQSDYDLACTENISRNSKDDSQVQRSDSEKGTVRHFGKRGQDTMTGCTSSVANEVVDIPRVSKQSEGEGGDTCEKEPHIEGPGGTSTYDLARPHVRPAENPSYGVEKKSSISLMDDDVFCLAI